MKAVNRAARVPDYRATGGAGAVAMKVDPLTGKFFHTSGEGGVIERQGRILSCVSPGLYLVQRFEWFFGLPSTQHVEPGSNMVGWTSDALRQRPRDAGCV